MNSLQEVLTSWGSSSTWSSWTPGQTAALWMSTNDASRAEEGRGDASFRIGQTGYSGKQVRQVALVVAWTRIWMARRISPTCRAVGGLVLELCPCQVDDGLLHRPVGPLVRGGPVGDAQHRQLRDDVRRRQPGRPRDRRDVLPRRPHAGGLVGIEGEHLGEPGAEGRKR